MPDTILDQLARYIADPERCMPSERERLIEVARQTFADALRTRINQVLGLPDV